MVASSDTCLLALHNYVLPAPRVLRSVLLLLQLKLLLVVVLVVVVALLFLLATACIAAVC